MNGEAGLVTLLHAKRDCARKFTASSILAPHSAFQNKYICLECSSVLCEAASGSADWGCLWKVTSFPVVSPPASNPLPAFFTTKLRTFFQPTLRTQTCGDLQERLRQNIFLPFPHHWVIFLVIRLVHFHCCAPGELGCSLVTKPTSGLSFPSDNPSGASCPTI